MSVCVFQQNEKKREKMKERNKGESRPKERRDVGEIEWMRMMGSGVRWGHTYPQNADLHFFFFF